MKYLIVLSGISFFLSLADLHFLLANLAMSINQNCLSLLPSSLIHSEYFNAFVCGKEINDEYLKTVLIKTSVYHLIVVSGSHLAFISLALEHLFYKLKKDALFEFILLAVLFLYCLATGFQAPVLRAFATVLLNLLNKKMNLFWSKFQIIFLAGFLCLILFPSFIESHSLLLSWTASLAISVFSKSIVAQSLGCYLFTLPLLAGWGQLHPIGILINIVLVPIITAFTLLSCLLLIFCPLVADYIVGLILKTLSAMSNRVEYIHLPWQASLPVLWCYLIFINIACQYSYLKNKRSHWRF